MDYKVGQFDVEVSSQYPVWIRLRYRGGDWMVFDHRELSDLKYAIERAIRDAKKELGETSLHDFV